jgi:hypothetical protein
LLFFDNFVAHFIHHLIHTKMLKKILLGIVGIIALLLIAALFVDKDFSAQRNIVINKPKAEVFAYLKSLKNQDNWSVWGKRDPNMKKEFVGTDGTVGCISKWSGNDEVGVGEQEIKAITEGEKIDFELRFKKPFESTSKAYLTTEAIDSTNTKVTWGFSGSMPYPMNLMKVFMNMEEAIGNDFDEGLNNLKMILDK